MNWYPSGAEALELARPYRRTDPALGMWNAACPLVPCDEILESEATAALMNADFVNIKVVAKNRPDLDRLYQLARQLLTRRGGVHTDDVARCHR